MGTLKKQTAVEWLIDLLKGYDEDCEIFNIAKAMEKNQIIEAWQNGAEIYDDSAEQYFKETFGGDK